MLLTTGFVVSTLATTVGLRWRAVAEAYIREYMCHHRIQFTLLKINRLTNIMKCVKTRDASSTKENVPFKVAMCYPSTTVFCPSVAIGRSCMLREKKELVCTIALKSLSQGNLSLCCSTCWMQRKRNDLDARTPVFVQPVPALEPCSDIVSLAYTGNLL